MMNYPQIPLPSRSDTLWKYTSWKRIHPTKVEEMPPADAIKFSIGEDFHLDDSEEIARSFLHSISPKCKKLSLVNESAKLDLEVNGKISCGELFIESRGDSTLAIRLKGGCDWTGLRILGDVTGNLSVSFINELEQDSNLLRCDNWIVNRNSTLELGTLSVGGKLNKSDIRIELKSQGSDLRCGIASNGNKTRNDDHHIEIQHSVGHTTSSLVMHASCNDSSRSIGTGMLKICEGADGSDAGQVFRNLLLSEKSRADAIPGLEVLADDVKAAHGAASAPVDKEQIFYLSSRGLSVQESSSLIVEGFLMDAFRQVKNPDTVSHLREGLLSHLEGLITG